jgi:hypothetical protein
MCSRQDFQLQQLRDKLELQWGGIVTTLIGGANQNKVQVEEKAGTTIGPN